MKHDLTIKVRKRDKTIIYDLKGCVIGSWALYLKEKLLDAKEKGIQSLILNFRDVTSIDGLCVIVIAEALAGGLRLNAVYLPSHCLEIFLKHRVGLKSYFNEDNALEELRSCRPSFPERRNSTRMKTRIPVAFTIPSGAFRGVLLNLSKGGALLGYYDSLSEEELLGTNITLTIEIALVGCIQLTGRTVDRRDHHEMPAIGLRLIHTSRSLSGLRAC